MGMELIQGSGTGWILTLIDNQIGTSLWMICSGLGYAFHNFTHTHTYHVRTEVGKQRISPEWLFQRQAPDCAGIIAFPSLLHGPKVAGGWW